MMTEKTEYNSWKLPLDYPAKEALIVYAKRLLWLTVVATYCAFLGYIVLILNLPPLICMVLAVVPFLMYMVYILYSSKVSYSFKGSRLTKVLATLLVSMTTGAIVLMALGDNPFSTRLFLLSTYYHLGSMENAILSRALQSPARWNHIEIYYSGTKAGNIEQLALLNGLTISEDLNCHFVICNGLGGYDGQIQPTEKWQRQWSIIPGRTWYGSSQTIRICVIADGKTAFPTNNQKKRVETLVERLCRKLDITSVYYPVDWQ